MTLRPGGTYACGDNVIAALAVGAALAAPRVADDAGLTCTGRAAHARCFPSLASPAWTAIDCTLDQPVRERLLARAT